MFNSIVYKIALNKNFSTTLDEFTWGIDKETTNIPLHIAEKINKGLFILGAPWKSCIPYYKYSYFVFINKNALSQFLYQYCNLTYDEIISLANYVKLYKLTISCISSGMSKFRGTVFDDEVDNVEEISFSEITSDFYAKTEETNAFSDINMCKERYYNKFKFKINF